MARLEILTYGHPVLRQGAEEVVEINGEILKLIKDMQETLEDNGIGLAAPQVGISKRILVVDLTKSKGDRKIALINPRIVYKSRETADYEEGCLSVPDVWGTVNRPKSIKIKGTLISGKTMMIDADDLFARVLQHEMDHLDGKLFIDYLNSDELAENRPKIEAILEITRKRTGKVCL